VVIEARVPGAKIDNDDITLVQWPNLGKHVIPQSPIEAAKAARNELSTILQLHLPSRMVLNSITRASYQRQGAAADKLQVKAANTLLDGLAKSKQDAINHGHGPPCLFRPPSAGAIKISKL
jgi:hypothetical protein